MSEAELSERLRAMLAPYGLYGYHSADSRRATSGWPDWVIVGSGVLYVELKSARGRLSTPQTRVRNALQCAGAAWRLWRPADLRSGLIRAELETIA